MNPITNTEKLSTQDKLEFESGVELFGIVNREGRMIDSVRSGTIDMPENKKEMFLTKTSLGNSMQQDFDEDLTPMNYCLIQRRSKKYISIPIKNNNTILVVTKKDVNHENIVASVYKMMNFSKIVKDVASKEISKIEHV